LNQCFDFSVYETDVMSILKLRYYEDEDAALFEDFSNEYDSLIDNLPQDRINAIRWFLRLLIELYSDT
jgi:hypothetical protein